MINIELDKGVPIAGGKFLVTGGASVIGINIVRALADNGAEEVRLLDNFALRDSDRALKLAERENVSLWRADVLRPEEIFPALEGVEGVFHTAGYVTRSLAEKVGVGLEVNVTGTERLLFACSRMGIRKVVYSSSVSVYGATTGSGITEDNPLRREGMSLEPLLYGCSKLVGEVTGLFFRDRYNLDFISLRYPSVYGEEMHDRGLNTAVMFSTYQQLRSGRQPIIAGDPLEAHDYIYAGDVAQANLAAMAAPCGGVAINIASGRSVTLGEVANLVVKLCGSAVEVKRGEASGLRITTARELSYSIERAQELLGWTPTTDLEEGLRRLICELDRVAKGAKEEVG